MILDVIDMRFWLFFYKVGFLVGYHVVKIKDRLLYCIS